MDELFRREYLVRLPLPLAQLYSRAHNAKQARARHDYAFYLCEALIKLATMPLAATYLSETSRGASRCAAIDERMPCLRLPSLGHWLGLLRELAKHFGTHADAELHPLGHLWNQLNEKRRDWNGAIALYQRIKNGPDGEPANSKSCSALELFDALVQYRNTVFGHGSSRVESFYEEEMGPLLLPAVTDLLADGVLDLLGPPGSQLIFLTEIRVAGDNQAEIDIRRLVGRESERADPVALSVDDVSQLAPNCVAVLWPGRDLPQRLDPLLAFRETELTEEVLFLNRDRSGKHVEYLSYTTGQTVRDPEMEPAMTRMLTSVPAPQSVAAANENLASEGVEAVATTEVETAPSNGLPRVHDFEILAELGRGGMGVVYLARQLSLGRIVALKTIAAELLDDEIALARFRREMRVLGRCDHPNIVKVFSCGAMPDGQLYYAMEYVPGADLEQVWRELAGKSHETGHGDLSWNQAVRTASTKQLQQATKKLVGGDTRLDFSRQASTSILPTTSTGGDAKIAATDAVEVPAVPTQVTDDYDDEDIDTFQHRIARLMRDAASALEAVHAQGIVHRDVKLANLILTADGSRVVLMDFGLAKGQSMALTTSRSGGLLGTLRYSAPEQLAAANMQVGPAVDIRGLGVTMWELLTTRRLFADAEDERQLASWVLNHDVPALRTVDPRLSPDLEAITEKATERNVESRIQETGKLVEYLDAYLDGKPVVIGKPKALQEFAARFAIPIVIVATLLPNAAAGAFNLVYNRNQIIQNVAPESLSVFWTTQTIINMIAYPIGVYLVGWFTFVAVRPIRLQRQNKPVDAQVQAHARRHSLFVGHYAALTGIALWSLAGITYPIAIHLASGTMLPIAYVHFFVSLMLCGLVAAAYPFFVNTWFIVTMIYPRLAGGSVYSSQDRQAFERLNRLTWRYFMCAAAVPMFTVAILATINSESRMALGVFGLGGLVGFFAITPIFRKLLVRLSN
jgi:serine/threonine protein kinase